MPVRQVRGHYKCPGLGVRRPVPPWLALLATLLFVPSPGAHAQSVTTDLFNPVRGNFNGKYDPLRKSGDNANQFDLNTNKTAANADTPAPSRIGKIPTYEVPAASGASITGYDSLGRKKPPAAARRAEKSRHRPRQLHSTGLLNVRRCRRPPRI